MRFCSLPVKDTLFPIKHEVKRQLVSRDEVEAYVTKHTTEDEDAKRLRRSELVLKKFGLLPRDFDLGTFLVALLKEQVAGYYDPKTKTVNLLDWLGADQQKPVLAHELTHALQDQSFNLEKYMKPADTDLDKKKEINAQDIENDEISTTRQAVVEGQAMVVLVDYMLEPMGLSTEGLAPGGPGSQRRHAGGHRRRGAIPECAHLHEGGADFPLSLWHRLHRRPADQEVGKTKAFASSFGILRGLRGRSWSRRLIFPGRQLEPMNVPDFRQVFKNYERFDVGAVGRVRRGGAHRSICRR